MASILSKCVRDASHMLGDGGLLCRWVPVEKNQDLVYDHKR